MEILKKTILRNIAFHKIVRLKEARLTDFPNKIDKGIVQYLKKRGIDKLFSHQRKALEEILNHKNVVVTSGVDSGKSLCYQLPILKALKNDPQAKSLLLFPTKALTQDQKIKFTQIISEMDHIKAGIGIYDGDTPNQNRKQIRKNANLIFTNPDMLHLGILPHHTNWSVFFQNLKFVVIDEVHIYRGIFGSHFANVIRRLKRIAKFYGSHPQFILTSATLSNVEEFTQNLIEEDVSIIDEDGSPTGERHYYIYNPPIIDQELGIRKSSLLETVKIAEEFYQHDYQSLIFTSSRRSVELILNYLRENHEENSIHGYRSGYLPSQRRKIERQFRNGEIKAVISTNALELGIDIGELDTVIINGYPGSVASSKQQFGRAGRKGSSSHCVLVANSNLLDQYLVKNPDYLFKRNPEKALIDPDNPFILLHHLKCALFEKPFITNEQFGDLSQDILTNYLGILQNHDLAYQSEERIFWKSNSYPADEISLRTTGVGDYVLKENGKTIGIVDNNSAFWFTHPQAVYIHQGETYLVTKLDQENKLINLEPKELDYFTQPQSKTDFELLKEKKKEKYSSGEKNFGQIKVIDQVTGYKKKKWYTNEFLGYGDVDLPAQELVTYGYWFTIGAKIVKELSEKGYWNSKENNYGKHWNELRNKVRRRDEYKCQHCGVSEKKQVLEVHHKIPFKQFTDIKKANKLENLVTLCSSCHKKAERQIYIQSGLAGIAYLLRNIAPFFLMCDSMDIRVQSSSSAVLNCQDPSIIFHDTVPGGIGLSEKLYDMQTKLLKEAYKVVSNCNCKKGCPACVGPVAESGVGAKKQVKKIFEKILKK